MSCRGWRRLVKNNLEGRGEWRREEENNWRDWRRMKRGKKWRVKRRMNNLERRWEWREEKEWKIEEATFKWGEFLFYRVFEVTLRNSQLVTRVQKSVRASWNLTVN